MAQVPALRPSVTVVWPTYLARMAAGIGLALLSVLLLVLALPPFPLWPLIFVGFVPMVLAWYRILPPRLSSLAPGVTFSGYTYIFIGKVLDNAPTLPGVLRLLALVGVGALIVLLTLRLRAFHIATGFRWQPLQGTVSWVGLLLIFTFIPYIATWPAVSYALYAQPWLIQPVSLLGLFALDALIMLLNYSLGLATVALWDRRWQLDAGQPVVAARVARRWLLLTAGCCGLWVISSLLVLRPLSGPQVRVAAIQPNQEAFFAPGWRADPPVGWQQQTEQRAWPVLLAQTRDAAQQGAQLIVWPEGALRADPVVQGGAALSALARDTRAYLVVPYVVETPAGLRNAVVLFSPTGAVQGMYHKSHPVPGELAPDARAYPVVDTPLGRLAMMICYDGDFLDTARHLAAGGAQLVAVPSADWPSITELHYTHLVFRAVENRVTMVKADWSFDSAVIDPYGRLVARTIDRAGRRSIVLADVALGGGPTVAIQLGDVVGWLGLAGMVAFTVAQALVRRAELRRRGGADR